MKGNPAVPGGPLTSKPTWSNTSGCCTTSAFFLGSAVNKRSAIGMETERTRSRSAWVTSSCSEVSPVISLPPRLSTSALATINAKERF